MAENFSMRRSRRAHRKINSDDTSESMVIETSRASIRVGLASNNISEGSSMKSRYKSPSFVTSDVQTSHLFLSEM